MILVGSYLYAVRLQLFLKSMRQSPLAFPSHVLMFFAATSSVLAIIPRCVKDVLPSIVVSLVDAFAKFSSQ